jgi:TonB family protein
MKLFKKDRSKISYALIFSLALHVVFFGFVFHKIHPQAFLSKPVLPSNQTASSTIKLDSIKFISQKQLQAIKENRNRQIVANELRGKEEKPVSTRFAGEKDQTFDRQSIAAANGSFKEAGKGVKNGSQGEAVLEASPKKQKVVAQAIKQSKKSLSLSDLGGFKVADAERLEKQAEEAFAEETKRLSEAQKLANKGVHGGKVGAIGLAANNDFIEDIPLGDMTNLNTTEYKYYGFYHRIRQKLEQHWGSSIKDKAKNLYRSGRRMPASDNLITAVTVTLNDRGHIVDIQIEGTSGVRELDQAAIESFNKAGPFPNPPKGLLVGGRATIQWGFVVKS